MLTGYSGCEFDLTSNSYREYNSFFRIRFGKWKDIQGVDKIYVNKIKSSQKMYSRANVSTTLKEYVYKCFIKFSDGEKLLLTQNKRKNNVLKEVQPIAKSYGLEVIDNTI
ncbi:hypothetical protein GCM10011506_15650 [Marivirga lumbricoides]|uniref:Uncharacterized protein n=2 Tax=Marivirga lumbricoides TaxID=1046115 RepID=A0ABQ1LX46_9BACT|nr:hypothetical protein GCM10011506_15650 [Marivirga lumbricoides]